MWTWFLNFLFEVLSFFKNILGDWGLGIIAIVILIRIILLPLTLKQQKSMADMQVLQPKLKEIQTRYKDDPQRLQEEMMKFYSEHKFNPAAGCLPLLIQMPVFIALYTMLRTDLPSDATLLNWLSVTLMPSQVVSQYGFVTAIPYIILMLAFGALTMIPMLMQQNTDKNMRIISVVMAIMMIFFGWTAPTGVLIYWDVSALWNLAQQFIINKKKKKQIALQEKEKPQPIEVNVVRTAPKKKPSRKSK